MCCLPGQFPGCPVPEIAMHIGIFFIDPLWIVISAPAILLSLWAQFRVKSNFQKFAQIGVRQKDRLDDK